MLYQYANKNLGGVILLTDKPMLDEIKFFAKDKLLKFFWNRSAHPTTIEIDGMTFTLLPRQLMTVTYYHQVLLRNSEVSLLAFNKEFYCTLTQDHEVSCYGILFFGAQDIPIITLDEEENRKFELLYLVFLDEFQTTDNIQGEMLQMLLKRLIIKCTRLVKQQSHIKRLENPQIETIRWFNFYVDNNFKVKKQVKDYALMLNKSPKTLANLFSTYHEKTPLQIIHERIVLEVKRLLCYSDKSFKEIGYFVGIEEATQLSKLFKKITGLTMGDFKKQYFSQQTAIEKSISEM